MLGRPVLSTGTVHLSWWFDPPVSRRNALTFPLLALEQCIMVLVWTWTSALWFCYQMKTKWSQAYDTYIHTESCALALQSVYVTFWGIFIQSNMKQCFLKKSSLKAKELGKTCSVWVFVSFGSLFVTQNRFPCN